MIQMALILAAVILSLGCLQHAADAQQLFGKSLLAGSIAEPPTPPEEEQKVDFSGDINAILEEKMVLGQQALFNASANETKRLKLPIKTNITILEEKKITPLASINSMSNNATSNNATSNNATSNNATFSNATFSNAASSNATFSNATSSNATSSNATSSNATSSNATSSNATYCNIRSYNATSNNTTLVELKPLQPTDKKANSVTYGIGICYSTILDKFLVDSNGTALYYFKGDLRGNGMAGCTGPCHDIWRPFYIDAITVMPGLNQSDFTTFTGENGMMQIAYKGWPLYHFICDTLPGDAKGQGIDGAWFVVNPGDFSPR